MYNEFYDRYEIIRELSCSRHSKVYLVRHRILDVYRVAKIFSGNQQDARRLMKEAHLIKNFKHPHIPVIYDIEQNIGEDDDSICIIEEYIDGKSLRQYVHDETDTRGYLSVHEICRIGIELCCILEYLHGYNGNGILHMDIKPDNIMVTRYGKELVLIDFGRSEHIDIETKSVKSNLGEADYNKEQSITRMYQYGTLGYAAPECYVNASNGSVFPFNDDNFEKGRMSIESDIFSFGATFWECLNVFELY